MCSGPQTCTDWGFVWDLKKGIRENVQKMGEYPDYPVFWAKHFFAHNDWSNHLCLMVQSSMCVLSLSVQYNGDGAELPAASGTSATQCHEAEPVLSESQPLCRGTLGCHQSSLVLLWKIIQCYLIVLKNYYLRSRSIIFIFYTQ